MRKTIITSLWLLLLLTGCSQDKEKLSYSEFRNDSLSIVLENTQRVYRLNYSMQLDRINPIIKLVDTNFDTCYLELITRNTDRLYFHYSDAHCSTCLTKQLVNLQLFQSKYGAESICILGSVQSYRSIVSLINTYDFKCDIYIIPEQQSIFKLHPYYTEPLYFTLKDKGSIDMFHFPLVEDSITTDLFLKLIHQKIKYSLPSAGTGKDRIDFAE